VAVLLPYKKKRLGRCVEYGEFGGGTADKQVWTRALAASYRLEDRQLSDPDLARSRPGLGQGPVWRARQ
jgi:hypothetical protein